MLGRTKSRDAGIHDILFPYDLVDAPGSESTLGVNAGGPLSGMAPILAHAELSEASTAALLWRGRGLGDVRPLCAFLGDAYPFARPTRPR
jgi:hypothetical protein